jgi:hypothetical protein
LSADGGIINAIKINVKEIVCAGVESIYLNWLKDPLLWTKQWTFRFHKVMYFLG